MPAVKSNKREREGGASVEVASSMGAGSSKLRKKIRDIERLLTKKKNLPADVRVANERSLKALKFELENSDLQNRAKIISKKYHMVRFFEKKKALRKLKQASKEMAELEANPDAEKKDLKKQRKVVKHCQVDLAYVINFSKTEKYISLYPNPKEEDAATLNNAKAKRGMQMTEQIRKSFRKECEAMFDNGTLPVSIEDVLEGKKLDNVKQASSGQAAPDATEKKAHEEEEDEFFE
ncbi:hypothetical protein BABINDRAFT_34486 [Babjeviella inositovora NRRL Y-12698]|uniref:rRNA-processing protein EFG1 n=1 Tax=Babjeviella inositovora NRRL Y-12698 TaxID=984486 RepID=A0A1E3QT13_9ASCO|nr:uncharacterized protein BABINDRAFT_34486 [Babjeviella inositovora NRRL Y-12698]ODQ80810.1 hypothetical protein BABINDRAFT_34486 [Babjeviella inositovora NRRL Y-12698]